jgi:hypothetical protein
MTDQEIISQKIRASLEDDGRLSCATAHETAQELEVDPLVVGDSATALDIQISLCQLGLFGHGTRGEGKGRVVHSGVEVREELAARVREALVRDRLPCSAAWEIARELKLTRLELGNVAETLGVRISPCQLGFF